MNAAGETKAREEILRRLTARAAQPGPPDERAQWAKDLEAARRDYNRRAALELDARWQAAELAERAASALPGTESSSERQRAEQEAARLSQAEKRRREEVQGLQEEARRA